MIQLDQAAFGQPITAETKGQIVLTEEWTHPETKEVWSARAIHKATTRDLAAILGSVPVPGFDQRYTMNYSDMQWLRAAHELVVDNMDAYPIGELAKALERPN